MFTWAFCKDFVYTYIAFDRKETAVMVLVRIFGGSVLCRHLRSGALRLLFGRSKDE